MTLQICRWTLAFIWIYQGLVPKLLGPHPDELLMSLAAGATPSQALWIAYVGGVLEVLLGLMVIVLYRWRPLHFACLFTVVAMQVHVLRVAPVLFTAAFNPMSINVALVALTLIALGELSGARAARPAESAA